MKPLFQIVVTLCLVLAIKAHPENIEEVKELPQTKEPIVEAEESDPQARVERCTTCSPNLKLDLKSPKDVLAAIKHLPGEVHTQESFESCTSEKGCAGVKVKDGLIVEKFGELDAFQQAAAQDLGKEFSFHVAGADSNLPFWWMNQNSPFKGSGSIKKFSKSSSYTSAGSGTLNNPSYQSSFSKQSFSSSSNGGVDLGSNPFLNGDIGRLSAAAFGQDSSYRGSSPTPFTTASGSNYFENNFQSSSNGISSQGVGASRQTCAGEGYTCVPRSQCNNGEVNTNGINVLQASSQKQYCDLQNEICCRIVTPGSGSIQGSYDSLSSQGSNLFSSGSDQSFASQGSSALDRGFNAVNRGSSSFGAQENFGASSAFGSNSNSFESNANSFGSNSNSYGSTVSANRGSSFDAFDASRTKNFGSVGSTVAPTPSLLSANDFRNEISRSSSQSNFIETDALASGSENNLVFGPGQPYLPPVLSTNFASPTTPTPFVSTPTFTPRPITPRPFTTPKPTYLPPVSSTSGPGYLPPFPTGEESNPPETRVPTPGPTYNNDQLILEETRESSSRPPVRPVPPPVAPIDIPAGCAAALKCTAIEYCTAEGVISTTPIALTREQEAYRVPLTDCRDVETGIVGKCCRDPTYTDPWPTNQLGKWVPGVFGGNDGRYVPDSRGSPSTNVGPQISARPTEKTGSTIQNSFITPRPTSPAFGPNQITPGYPSSTGTPFIQKNQFESAGQGQYSKTSQSSFGVSQIGQSSIGQRGQTGQFGVGQIGQVGIVALNRGTQGQFGQGTQSTQFQGQGFIQSGGKRVNQDTGFLQTQGIGQVNRLAQSGSQGFGQQGTASQFGTGQYGQGRVGQVQVQQGFGTGVQQNSGSSTQQGGGIGALQGGGAVIRQGGGIGVLQGGGAVIRQGGGLAVQQGSGFAVQQGRGSGVRQGAGIVGQQGFGNGVRQGTGVGVITGQGTASNQGAGRGFGTGVGQYDQSGSQSVLSQGGGYFGQGSVNGFRQQGGGRVTGGVGTVGSQGIATGVRYQTGQQLVAGRGEALIEGKGEGVKKGEGQIVTQGAGQIVTQGERQIVKQSGGQYTTQEFVTQSQGQGVRQGGGAIITQGQGQIFKQGGGQVVTQGGGQYVQQGTGQYVTQGQGQTVIQGIGTGITQGQGFVVSQGGGYGVENEYSASTQRVYLQKYSGAGECGLLNPQKPYGNRNELEVDFAEIPWQAMVLLQTNRSLLCGGVITRPEVVVTSASCVDGLDAKNIRIKGGEWKLGIDDEPLPFQIVEVKTIIRHPEYKRGSLKYDVAILVLTENLRFAKNIQPICLPSKDDTLDAFYNGAGECMVTGWGKIVLQAHLSGSIMHAVNVSLINPGECEAKLSQEYPHLLEQYDEDSCVCGQPSNPLNNICKVDIGSALACTTGDSHFVLRGIYSWDSGCQIGNQVAGFYKFDVEWYEWAIGLSESVRFSKYTIGTKVTQNKITSQLSSVKSSQFSGGVKGSVTGIKNVVGATGSNQFGPFQSGSEASIFSQFPQTESKAFGQFSQGQFSAVKDTEAKSQGEGQFNQFGSTKFTELKTGEGALDFGSQIKGPLSKTFTTTYKETKVFQTEPKYVTYTTKPEIVTFTTKPEYFTYTTKPKIVTYTTKPKIVTYTTKPEIVTYTTKPEIVTFTTKPEYFTYTTKPKIISYTTKPQFITYETSGSGTNPQYVAPGVTFNPSFSDLVGTHKHNSQCKCLEGKP